MKYVVIIIFAFFFTKSCSQSAHINQDALEIEYSTFSRSSFTIIKINNKLISYSNDRDLQDFTTIKCPKKSWNTIFNHLEKLDWKQLETLEAPSDKRLYDGALHASFQLSYKGKIYKTMSFDHDQPPKEIELLIRHIVSLAETVE